MPTKSLSSLRIVDAGLYEPLFRLFIGQVKIYDRTGYLAECSGNRS